MKSLPDGQPDYSWTYWNRATGEQKTERLSEMTNDFIQKTERSLRGGGDSREVVPEDFAQEWHPRFRGELERRGLAILPDIYKPERAKTDQEVINETLRNAGFGNYNYDEDPANLTWEKMEDILRKFDFYSPPKKDNSRYRSGQSPFIDFKA